MSRSWPVGLEFLRSAIVEEFQHDLPPRPAPYGEMSLVELDRWSPDWAASSVDPGGFLDPYRRLPSAERQPDLLLANSGDGYWLSEYVAPSGSVEFGCGLILHLTAAGPQTTTVSVFELVPRVRAGRRWAWATDGVLFGRIDDIRFVEPTVTDRHHVLAWIDTLVRR